jgi:FkbH-like protein
MFQTQFSKRDIWALEQEFTIEQHQKIERSEIDGFLEALWEEHCTECGHPDCYSICSLYSPRGNNACSRFQYGIVENENFKGRFNFGADIKFKKWGKLEADLRKSFYRSANGAPPPADRLFDEFVIECYSPSEDRYHLTIEYFTLNNLLRKPEFKASMEIGFGCNRFVIPFEKLRSLRMNGYFYLCPDTAEKERRLIFTWLDFISYRKPQHLDATESQKVKCIAWDLDNTLWLGTLLENEEVSLRAGIADIIDTFDKRGILQTVISKNDFESAWSKLQAFGLDRYFLYPAINWNAKSDNLITISKKLNIGLDSFAVVDDSVFELEEIRSSIGNIRLFKDTDIDELLHKACFDVPITSASSTRRQSYQEDTKRILSAENFLGTYDEFLVRCAIKVRVFKLREESEIVRCWELIQRSNQLNLSGRRYSLESFRLLVESQFIVALECEDKFGSYGIIGCFIMSFESNDAYLHDFVLSCRIAQKKIEHSFLSKLIPYLHRLGYCVLHVTAAKTGRNFPMIKVFEDLHFEIVGESESIQKMRYDLSESIDINVVDVVLDID